MTSVVFKKHADEVVGVTISGHSGYADAGEDIVCAAITSAIELCECAITDVIGAKVQVLVNEDLAEIRISLPKHMDDEKRRASVTMLTALKLHLMSIEEEYPQCIKVSEV